MRGGIGRGGRLGGWSREGLAWVGFFAMDAMGASFARVFEFVYQSFDSSP